MNKHTSKPSQLPTEEIPHQFIKIGKNAVDLTGQKFGRLTVLGPVNRTIHGNVIWLCKCTCDNLTSIRAGNLKSGHTQSCGCLNEESRSSSHTTHGLSHYPLYYVYLSMIRRCHEPSDQGYQNYGARGISVCKEWRDSFLAFYNCVSALPHFNEKGYSLDRTDNSLGYTPNNVRFATQQEQTRNTRRNVEYVYKGESKCLSAWALHLDIKRSTLLGRLESGWTIEKAFAEPVKTKAK